MDAEKTNYQKESWWLEGLYLDASPIHGQGIFTSRPIAKGTVVIRWGGVVFTDEDLKTGRVREHTYVGIGSNLYLANEADKAPTLDDYINHSCDGNLWMVDEVTLEARRNILVADELTADYALWLNKPDYRMKNSCVCRSQNCRQVITGIDWQRDDVQERNRGHFSPFINKLIAGRLNS